MACGHIATATRQELLAKSLSDTRIPLAPGGTHKRVNLAAEARIRTLTLKNVSIDQGIFCGLAPEVYEPFHHTVESSVVRIFRGQEQAGHDKVRQINCLIEVRKRALFEPLGPRGLQDTYSIYIYTHYITYMASKYVCMYVTMILYLCMYGCM